MRHRMRSRSTHYADVYERVEDDAGDADPWGDGEESTSYEWNLVAEQVPIRWQAPGESYQAASTGEVRRPLAEAALPRHLDVDPEPGAVRLDDIHRAVSGEYGDSYDVDTYGGEVHGRVPGRYIVDRVKPQYHRHRRETHTVVELRRIDE